MRTTARVCMGSGYGYVKRKAAVCKIKEGMDDNVLSVCERGVQTHLRWYIDM